MSEENQPRWGSDETPSAPTADAVPGQAPPSSRPNPGPWGLLAGLGWMVLLVATYFLASILSVVLFGLFQTFGRHSYKPPTRELLENSGDFLWINLFLVLVFCGSIILIAVFLRRGYPPRQYLALERVGFRAYLKWLVLLVVLAEGSNLALAFFGLEINPQWMFAVYQSATCLPCFLLALLVAAPLFEELLFRGFIFTTVQARLGNFWAVVFGSVPWALLHFQYREEWYYLAIILGLGVLLCLARLFTRSLYIPLAMHFLNNLLACLEIMWSSSGDSLSSLLRP